MNHFNSLHNRMLAVSVKGKGYNMDATVAAAFISGGTTLVVCMANNYFQRKETDKKHSETIQLINYKLEELTKRVDKHNNVIERTYRLEEKTAIQDEQIKVANHRIDDLEDERIGKYEKH